MTAPSSSDRYDAARTALERVEDQVLYTAGPGEGMARAEADIAAIRAVIEPPATEETPEQIAGSLFDRYYHDTTAPTPLDADAPYNAARALVTAGVRAGIHAAWESQSAPAFKPEGEPDEYRDAWEDIQYRGHTLTVESSNGECAVVTRDQARRILEMLSSEASA
jgi:hypothetical protein